MRSGEVGRSLRRRIRACEAAANRGRSSKLRGNILQPHIEINEKSVHMYKKVSRYAIVLIVVRDIED